MSEAGAPASAPKRPRLQAGSQERPGSPADGLEVAGEPRGVAMSVACWGGRVGVAWYSQEEGEVRGVRLPCADWIQLASKTSAAAPPPLVASCRSF